MKNHNAFKYIIHSLTVECLCGEQGGLGAYKKMECPIAIGL